MNITAILLAAGTSSRMGGPNKLLLPVGSAPMVRVVAQAILGAGITDVLVVTGRDREAIGAALNGLPVRLIHNQLYQRGMTTSIQAGVSAALGEGYLICLADMPFLKSKDYAALSALFRNRCSPENPCIVVPIKEGKRRNPVLFSYHFREEILRHTHPEGCSGILQAHPEKIHLLPFESSTVFGDLDTPEAYRRMF